MYAAHETNGCPTTIQKKKTQTARKDNAMYQAKIAILEKLIALDLCVFDQKKQWPLSAITATDGNRRRRSKKKNRPSKQKFRFGEIWNLLKKQQRSKYVLS